MKLSILHEGVKIHRKVLNLLHKYGRTHTFDQLADMLGVSHQTFQKLILLGGSTYGREDIKDIVLYEIRALRNLRILLNKMLVDDKVINKLVRFYLDNKDVINKHRPSPSDQESIRQLINGERLVSLISHDAISHDTFDLSEFIVHPCRSNTTLVYVTRKGNEDIIKELVDSKGKRLDLIQGMAFGYRSDDILSYIRASYVRAGQVLPLS